MNRYAHYDFQYGFCTKNGQVFRDESCNPNTSQDAGLKLELGDFAPKDLARGISGSILVDAVTLSRFLDEAEEEEQEAKQKKRTVDHLEPGAKKQRREKTPPENMNSDDERRWSEEERRIQARELADDSSFHSSQS